MFKKESNFSGKNDEYNDMEYYKSQCLQQNNILHIHCAKVLCHKLFRERLKQKETYCETVKKQKKFVFMQNFNFELFIF